MDQTVSTQDVHTRESHRVTTEIVKAFPPNIDIIAAVFGEIVRTRETYFAYGKKIYNPHGGMIHPSIIRHEEVHLIRQGSDADKWWDEYITNVKFRLDEEIAAHRAEFKWYKDREYASKPAIGWRNQEQFYLFQIANKLRAPLYNFNLSLSKAKALIQ